MTPQSPGHTQTAETTCAGLRTDPARGLAAEEAALLVLIYLAAMRAVYQYEKRTLIAFVAAGSWLPFVARDLAEFMGWGQSFVGTLLVAAMTTAPEAVVTLSALRIGAVDMAIANLLGSNLFNIAILAIDDVFYAPGPLLAAVSPSHAFTALTAVMISALVIVGLVYRPRGRVVLGLGGSASARSRSVCSTGCCIADSENAAASVGKLYTRARQGKARQETS